MVAPGKGWKGWLRLDGDRKDGCAWTGIGRMVAPGHMGSVIKRDFAIICVPAPGAPGASGRTGRTFRCC